MAQKKDLRGGSGCSFSRRLRRGAVLQANDGSAVNVFSRVHPHDSVCFPVGVLSLISTQCALGKSVQSEIDCKTKFQRWQMWDSARPQGHFGLLANAARSDETGNF